MHQILGSTLPQTSRFLQSKQFYTADILISDSILLAAIHAHFESHIYDTNIHTDI